MQPDTGLALYASPRFTPSDDSASGDRGPGETRMVQKRVPEPGPAEVLASVDAAAICATDLLSGSGALQRRYFRNSLAPIRRCESNTATGTLLSKARAAAARTVSATSLA